MGLLPYLVPRSRVALDIGGNVGSYAFLLQQLAAKVVVMEPNPELAAELTRSLGERVTIVQAAASNVVGRTMLRMPRDKLLGGLATISDDNRLSEHDTVSIEVPTKTVDSLALVDVGFIKIDVEGAEAQVLEGARETIARDKPVLLVEAEERHRSGAVSLVRERLEPLGYEGYMLVDGALASICSFSSEVHQQLGAGAPPYVNNFVFLPRARATTSP
jgi:FkbM family methyltransferase